MSVITRVRGDTITVRVEVCDQLGNRYDLTGATVEARMKTPTLPAVSGTVIRINDPFGIVDAVFAEGVIDFSGEWTFQMRVTKGGEVQTVATQHFEIIETIF